MTNWETNDFSTNRLFISIPYKYKDFAKANHCKWNSEVKSWYITKQTTMNELAAILNNNNIKVKKYYSR